MKDIFRIGVVGAVLGLVIALISPHLSWWEVLLSGAIIGGVIGAVID